MKITKSELKEMIREALREEFRLREGTENTGCERINSIESALDQAYTNNANALVVTKPGMNSIAKARAWCEANSLSFAYINATDKDLQSLFDSEANKIYDGVLLIDEYDCATPSARAQLTQLIQEQTYGQLFTVALCHPGIGRGLYDGRVFTLNFEIL